MDPSPIWLPRRYYLFALRDELPLPDTGWSVHLHAADCAGLGESKPRCTADSCRGIHCRFTTFKGDSSGFPLAMSDLSIVLQEIIGRIAEEPLSLDSLPATRTVLAVGGAILLSEAVDDHYHRCFQLAHDAVKALRLSANAHVPNLSIERVWPTYFIVVEREPGKFELNNIALVEHGFANTPAATEDKLREASTILLAGWRGSPVETYRDFKLSAQNAAWVDGNYIDAVLKAATAAEVLLKHTAWMLIWEASEEMAADPAPAITNFDPFAAKPSQLIGNVLTRRLGGDWSSQDDAKPIGAWRTNIARRRNAVIHRGYRPTEREIPQTVAALHQLEQHVLDRLAAMARAYPRTAVLLVGGPGLERRGARQDIQAPAGDTRTPDALMPSYLGWLSGQLRDDAGD